MNRYKSQYHHHKSPLNLHKSLLNLHKSPLNLHKTFFSILSLFFLFIFWSCERVIDVDLNEASPEIVIEGNLSGTDAELEVTISKTGSYFNTGPVEKVKNVRVVLENGQEHQKEAKETADGRYRIDNISLVENETYKLIVKAENKEYQAVSTLYEAVKVDSLSYEYSREARFFEGGYRVLLYFSDPANTDNYYRVKIYKNQKLFNGTDDIIVFDDSSLDGKGIQVRLRGQVFDLGDTAKVELLSIDKNAWLYFTTLRDMVNANPGSPAPANPVSNFNNGALGYFSAWSVSKKEIVIE